MRNPAGFVKKLRTPRLADEVAAATNVLEPSEYPRLLSHFAPEHRVMARFLFESGCRFGEAMGLKFDDLDFASNKVAIRRQRDRAGLRSIRVHDARHSHASWLIAAGLDIVEVSRRLGHANAAITLKVYSHQIAKRSTPPVSEKLAQFMASEAAG